MAGFKGEEKVQPDGTFGWEELSKLVDPVRVRKAMQAHFKQAMGQIGHKFEARATDIITVDKPFEGNAPLTILLKGTTTPLVEHGDLVGSLTHNVKSWRKLQMGVNSRELPGSGRLLAEVLHEGATIKVTPAMRAAVFNKLKDKLGADAFKKLAKSWGPAKKVWVIPPRPFLTKTFADREFTEFAANKMLEALDASLTLPSPGASE